MSNITAVVNQYIAIWNEPDAAVRLRRIRELWEEDEGYINESQEQHGHRAIEATVIEAYHEFVEKGFVFRSVKNADGHHNVIRFNWEMVPASGGQVAAAGFDFFVLGEDGRIHCDYQFSEPFPTI